jgi:hypothetical protein
MKICEYCKAEAEWAFNDQTQRWVLLVPVGQDEGLERAFVDSDGKLRAAHREVCTNKGEPRITVTKLDRPIPGALADNHADAISKPRRRNRNKKNPNQEELSA